MEENEARKREIRLNDGLRRRLYDLVRTTVKVPAEAAKLDRAYAEAEPLVREAVHGAYPPDDMEICAKYEAAQIDDCVKLQLTSGGVDLFKFAPGTGPLVVKKTHQGMIYLADAITTDAFHNWKQANEAFETALRRKMDDYGALVREARTLDEVCEIWPEAEVVREYARSRALSILSDEMIARIRADVAARQSEGSA